MPLIHIANVPGMFRNLWDKVFSFFWALDTKIMEDIEWEHRCILSGVFLTLFGVCACLVLLMAIMFTLDEMDME